MSKPDAATESGFEFPEVNAALVVVLVVGVVIGYAIATHVAKRNATGAPAAVSP